MARRYDAGVNAVKGAAFSLPGRFMQWATGPSNTTAQSLMKGYNSNSTASVENSVTEMEKNNVGKE